MPPEGEPLSSRSDSVPASGFVVTRLLENLEIDWRHFRGPELNRDGEVSESDGGQGGPNLKDFDSDDLGSVASLLAIHRDAVARGLVPNSENGLLGFLSTAQSCLRRGRNPATLFRWLIEARIWNEASLEDEDVAHEALKAHFRDRHPPFLKKSIFPPSPPETTRPRKTTSV